MQAEGVSKTMSTFKKIAIAFSILALVCAFAVGTASAEKKHKKAKNIIIMISDGAGYNTHLATRYWQGKKQPYETHRFSEFPVATYNLRYGGPEGTAPGDDSQDLSLVYDPLLAWDDSPVEGDLDGDGYLDYFAGYRWLQSTDPDSAGTMSALMTARKIYRGGINIDGYGNNLWTVPEAAKAAGKSTGSISTVRYNHATPAAGGGAHNISRNNYIDISYEMFGAGVLDVMGGPGHPWYNSNGSERTSPSLLSSRFDAPLWEVISTSTGSASRTTVDGRNFTVYGDEWRMYDDKADIEALAAGEMTVPEGRKLMLLPKVWGTLQYERDITEDWDGDGTIDNRHPDTNALMDLLHAPVNPGDNSDGDPWIETVPTLVDMTMAAINYLDDNPKGFYLHIEGGACDWAMHGNSMGRMIEEHTDFNNSVQAIMDYLDNNTNGNNWDNTLLIVTSDHDHNLYGPESDVVAFQDVTREGKGELPGHIWHDNNHGNQLVPAWISGPNVDLLPKLFDGVDPVQGRYIDQVDLGHIMFESIADK
jgi:alkaline phosphatase